ncbi:MAG TPA: YjjG family noncanonical pyrimidine nucleotidase [Flavobacterium sp.]|jgi:YjjG family noncanonical pyrimidine nucleotidase|uniref:YjjG family noncanonical pyrimidine nucleotidase n=1 Tax=Flavobacterium sp. TaxID=239 RepID=UPI002D1C0EE4|nr:YjjG family noncanonical pyrimidine nucleotidase [Flavobacterium sp.]MCA0348300.1 YjjG family noncanonical pyrimidine nucleotidase [Bacteroidota bacterium]HPW98579.1 YjjG family noncanonical pyrimidine nucleotidase [Flavobacterium sp.]HQA74496.1 YjjG family noncanonical pyrimidine nucleotidase [Flavobacterium sp.]
MMNNITDIFFDLDHTLWDFDKNSIQAFDKIFKKQYPTIDTVVFMEKYVPINQACWKLYQFDKMTHEELRYQRLKQSFDAINFAISDAEINQISHDYIEFLPDNNLLFDGAMEVLEYLKPKYTLHIITNGFAEVQTKKLNNSGINDYFKTVTNSEIAGVKKPHPNIFEFALSLTSVSKENALMIGDCIDADIRGAINFGIKAILFDQANSHNTNEVQKINHLLELKKIL